MPCYEMRTVSVEFKAENLKLLLAGLKAQKMDYEVLDEGNTVNVMWGSIVLDLKAGQAQVQSGYQTHLNGIKRAYSKECVKAAAKKVAWGVKFNGLKAKVNKVQW